MKIALITIAALALTGCVAHTMAGVRQRHPVMVADSDKPTEAIGSCLVEATDKLGIASYVPRPHGASIEVQVAGMFGDKAAVGGADIDDQGPHRHVTVWMMRTVWAKQNRHRLEAMRACL